MHKLFKGINSYYLLGGIVLLGIVSRFYGLTFQSYWYDELYIMDVANPSNTFSDILLAMKIEFHPPFHYFASNLFFKVFGFNDFTGRFLSALLGMFGIIAMYFFGVEIKDKKTGLLMALLTTINYYHLYHSQEVRMYISLFLFTALSSVFLLRIFKRNSIKYYLLFALFVTLNLYTHYFAVFVFVSQALSLLHFSIISKSRKQFVKSIILLVFISLLYLPWLPFIINAGGQSHWMGTPDIYFFFVYLYELLGKEPLGFLIFIVGIFMFLRHLFFKELKSASYNNLIFFYLFSALFFVYVLGYLVSLFKPVLQLRCTIAALPFLIAVVVIGISHLKPKVSRLIFSALVISSIVNVLFINKYYTKFTKEDFRGVSEIVKNNDINSTYLSTYALGYNYYFGQIEIDKDVINPSVGYQEILSSYNSFTILNAHNDSNIMTLHKYSDLANYIKLNYVADTIIYSPHFETEYLTVYKKK